MVGVRGRSKGCAECRKRKKGCDLQTPSCGRCIRARVQCPGYDRDRAFVFVQNLEGAPTKALTRPPKRVVAAPIAIQGSLSQSAYREKYLGLLWDIYHFEEIDYPSTGYRARRPVGAWVPLAKDLYQDDPALHKALLSLSLTTIGERKKEQWMVEEGVKLHCNSLSDLTAGLESPERSLSEPLLLAARILGMYEVLYSGGDDQGTVTRGLSWREHNFGLKTMYMQRTPEMHVNGRAHELYADARIILIFDALLARKRSPFSDTLWKTIPWTKQPKTPKDFLFDILDNIAGLLEDADLVSSCRDPSLKTQLRRKVVQDSWSLESDLARWFNSFASQQQVVDLLWGSSSPMPTDFPIAHLLCIYWAACILIYGTLRIVSPAMFSDLPDRMDPLLYCKNIIDMVEMFSHPTSGDPRMHSLGFPLGTAFLYLTATEAGSPEGPSPEAQKLEDCLLRGGELSRLRMRQFIKSAMQASCPRVARCDSQACPDDDLVALSRAWFGIEPVVV